MASSVNGSFPDESSPAKSSEGSVMNIINQPWIRVHGCRSLLLSIRPDKQQVLDYIEAIRGMKIRDDDVLLTAFPKCGTNWLWEVVTMVLRQRTTLDPLAKGNLMLELCDLASVDAQTSPRVINSHNHIPHLPQEIIDKKTKIIHVVRNPKDTIISLFHHFVQYDPKVTFEELMEKYMLNEIAIEHQFDFLRQMQDFQEKHPDHPIHLVYYEDMKKNPVEVVKGLTNFLGVPASDEYCRQVVDACSFSNMKNFRSQKKDSAPTKEWKKAIPQLDLQVYRKGIIGDWKNKFTVAMNEVFDDFIAKESKGLKFRFVYE